MEAHANSTDDYLVDGLSYQLKPGASYVQRREFATWFPQGSDTYSSTTGVKVIKIRLSGDTWLDPSTVRLMFDITNTHAADDITFISGPHCFFRRLRILAGGTCIEDIDNYNKIHEMFSTFQTTDVRHNDDIEGMVSYKDTLGHTHTYLGLEILAAGQKITMGMKLCSGILNQDKMLPIRYCPLEIELELVNHPSDSVKEAAPSWTLSNVQLKADTITLDSALQNSYASHLLEGKSLNINFQTYVAQEQVVTNWDFSINISRAASRLKAIFISLMGNLANVNLKEFNTFWHPMGDQGALAGRYRKDFEFETQVQIGSKVYPSNMPIRSVSEAFCQLRKTLGVHSSSFHALDVTPAEYRSFAHIQAIDLEKMIGSSFTGENTRDGSLMTVKIKAQDAGAMPSNPTKITTCIITDNILEIRDTGVVVFD